MSNSVPGIDEISMTFDRKFSRRTYASRVWQFLFT